MPTSLPEYKLKIIHIAPWDLLHFNKFLVFLLNKTNTECELDAMDQSGCTPLHHACINAPDGHRSVKVLFKLFSPSEKRLLG